MNKAELIESVASQADLTKTESGRAVDAVFGAIAKTLSKQGTVSLIGFGTFSTHDRAARSGRNPRTGETIQIPASRVPKFKPGKSLKESVN